MTRRILIIDDEDDLREVAQAALETVAGWQVLTAASGPEGLERARAEGPDAILLDVMMPGADGMTALERLRADPGTAAIPVILLTAKVRVARHPPGAGAAGVILKPFDPLKLAGQVAEILGWSSK